MFNDDEPEIDETTHPDGFSEDEEEEEDEDEEEEEEED